MTACQEAPNQSSTRLVWAGKAEGQRLALLLLATRQPKAARCVLRLAQGSGLDGLVARPGLAGGRLPVPGERRSPLPRLRVEEQVASQSVGAIGVAAAQVDRHARRAVWVEKGTTIGGTAARSPADPAANELSSSLVRIIAVGPQWEAVLAHGSSEVVVASGSPGVLVLVAGVALEVNHPQNPPVIQPVEDVGGGKAGVANHLSNLEPVKVGLELCDVGHEEEMVIAIAGDKEAAEGPVDTQFIVEQRHRHGAVAKAVRAFLALPRVWFVVGTLDSVFVAPRIVDVGRLAVQGGGMTATRLRPACTASS